MRLEKTANDFFKLSYENKISSTLIPSECQRDRPPNPSAPTQTRPAAPACSLCDRRNRLAADFSLWKKKHNIKNFHVFMWKNFETTCIRNCKKRGHGPQSRPLQFILLLVLLLHRVGLDFGGACGAQWLHQTIQSCNTTHSISRVRKLKISKIYFVKQRWGKAEPAWLPSGRWAFLCHSDPWVRSLRGSGSGRRRCDLGTNLAVCTYTQMLLCGCLDHHPLCAWTDPSPLHESALSVNHMHKKN